MLKWIVTFLGVALPLSIAVAETPVRGGILEFGTIAEPPSYDCHAGSSFAALHVLAPHYSTLLKFDLQNYPQIAGDLAKEWTISADHLTYTFKLNDDVLFHDGTLLTSRDVKASFERIRNPPEGVVSVRKELFADIADIETPNDSTVVVRLKTPNVSMLENIALPWNCIYSSAKLADDPQFPAKTVLGTGPFVFDAHEKGAFWTGKRFDRYFRADLPYLDGFRAIFMPQPAAMLNALQGGVIKTDFRGVTPGERDRLVTALGDKLTVLESPGLAHLRINFNTAKPPFNDPRVRRALILAIDRWAGSAGLARTSRVGPVGGIMRPGSPMASSTTVLETYPGFGRNIDEARRQALKLLKEAGAENLKFTLINRNTSPYTPVEVYLIDQWRRIGVNVDHQPLEVSPWTAALRSGNYDAIIDFNSTEIDDPTLVLNNYISTMTGAGASVEKLQKIYEAQIGEQDPVRRKALVGEAEKIIIDDDISAPLFWMKRIIVQWSDMHGWVMSPSTLLGQDLSEVWLKK